MNGINVCAFLGGNTGQSACEVRMSAPKYFMPTRGKVFSAADIATAATLKAALLAAMLLSRNDANKVFCFPVMRKVDDNTADPKTEVLDDGYEEVLNESLPSYTLQSTAGVCQTQGMVSFNGWADKAYVIDKNNIFWAVRTDTDGAQGWTVGSLYTHGPRFGNTSNIVTSKTKIVFGNVDEFKLAGGIVAVKVNFDPSKLANTVDVILSEYSAATGYAFKISGSQVCAGTDIYAAYKTLLDQTGAWKATLLDGTVVVVSSAAHNDLGYWTVTLASSPTITAAVKIIIGLVDPTALAALTTPVKGIEGIDVIVAKP